MKLNVYLGNEKAGFLESTENRGVIFFIRQGLFAEKKCSSLVGFIEKMNTRPLMRADENLRLSLAGAQEKLALIAESMEVRFHP